jgi:hypothetical protein
MSLSDYEESKRLSSGDPSFRALIMAAMRKADTDNLDKLETCWPDTLAELKERYNTPGGLIASEQEAREAHSDPSKPAVFIVGSVGGLSRFDYTGHALAEDGTGLGSHLCSSLEWVHDDMFSDHHQKDYREHYPDGYRIEWLGEWPKEGKHPAFDAALALNRANAPKEPV